MAQTTQSDFGGWTALDLVQRFGAIPLHRIRHAPPPGTATERDVIEIREHEDRLCELVDGVLVEKAMGKYEAYLGSMLNYLLWAFVHPRKLGVVLSSDAMLRLAPGLIRIPDVCFFSWARLPGRKVTGEAFYETAADLAVEVISPSNTRKEMQQKLQEYFAGGARLVWYVYHRPRKEVRVYTSPQDCSVLAADQMLDGGDVLPGFRLELRELFAEPEEPPTEIPARK
jgi:Uma2 family endonuclease